MDESVRLYEHPMLPLLAGDTWHPGGLALTAELADHAGLGKGQRVLDAGCGRGATARLLAERGCDVVGLDAGAKVLRAARRAGNGQAPAQYLQARAHPLPFRDGAFDALVSECSMCLFGGPGPFLAEAGRVLRPGGALAVTDVTLAAPRASFACAAGMAACLGGAGPREGLARAARDAGFAVERLDDRSDLVQSAWARLSGQLDVHRMARDFAPVLAGLGLHDPPAFVAEVEEAVRSGDLGYALLVARKER